MKYCSTKSMTTNGFLFDAALKPYPTISMAHPKQIKNSKVRVPRPRPRRLLGDEDDEDAAATAAPFPISAASPSYASPSARTRFERTKCKMCATRAIPKVTRAMTARARLGT